MREYTVVLEPYTTIAITEQGAIDSCMNALKDQKIRTRVMCHDELEEYDGTREMYESMLDYLQGNYAEYLTELTPDEVQYLLSNELLVKPEDVIQDWSEQ